MGRWVMQGKENDWPLHLTRSIVEKHPAGIAESTMSEGLTHDFLQWGQRTDDKTLAGLLADVHAELEATMHAFPDFGRVTNAAFMAVKAIHRACRHIDEHDSANKTTPTHTATLADINTALDAAPLDNRALFKKLSTKQQQLGRVIMIASGVRVRAWTDRTFWRPGETGTLTMDCRPPAISTVHCQAQVVAAANNLCSTPWMIDNENMALVEHALPSNPYPDSWNPLQPAGPVIELKLYSSSSSSSSSSQQ